MKSVQKQYIHYNHLQSVLTKWETKMNWPFPTNFNTNQRTPESQELIDKLNMRDKYSTESVFAMLKQSESKPLEEALF